MEKDRHPQPQPEEDKPNQNESLFHRLGEVNVMPDGMLSPVNETAYVNSIINENATEVDNENRQKK
jgi:hypothetical protein